MAQTVVGLYEHFEDAQKAVAELQDSGFRREDISVAASDASGVLTRDIGDITQRMNVERVVENRDTDQGEDVGKGAGIGAVLGGAIGLLFGIGAFAIPGIGPLLVAGPLVSILTGTGIGAATGGLIGALTSAGLSDAEAREYYEGLQHGGTLVMVNVPEDMIDQAEEILGHHSPLSVREPAEIRDTSLPGTATNSQPQVGDDTYARENAARERANDDAEIRTTSEDAVATTQTNVLMTGRESAEREEEQQAKSEVGSLVGGVAPGMAWDAGRLDLGEAEAGRYENEFRAHYQRNYIHSEYGYEPYQRAYHYGFGLDESERYREREWNEIEPNVRDEWERAHPGHPWEDFKDAVREGWDRVRGRR